MYRRVDVAVAPGYGNSLGIILGDTSLDVAIGFFGESHETCTLAFAREAFELFESLEKEGPMCAYIRLGVYRA